MSRDRALALSASWATVAIAVASFSVAYDDGGYSLTSRSTIAVAVWWTIGVGVGLGVWPRERVARGAIAPGVLLALFAAWDLASAAWAASAEAAFEEFDRTALYLGIYILVVLTSSSRRLFRWIDGLTLGIVAIGIVALISRLFPGSFSSRGLPTLLPSASTRLSFPLGYWNGLGIFVGLAVPLLLHSALAGTRRRRMAALGALPALGAVVYLTSSRGAVAAIAVGALVFVLAQPRRWEALGAGLAAAAGTALAVAVLATRHALVDGPLGSAAARTEGWQAAILIFLICMATAIVAEVALAIAPRLPAPAPAIRRLGVAVVVAATIGGVVYKAHGFSSFTQLPTARASSTDTVGQHLLSGSGSGRWQFWKAALDEFRSAPLQGRGAGSFETWWAQHGSFSYFVRDAHSLYFQTLGELGLVGFLLLVSAFAAGVLVATRRLGPAGGAERTAIAALLGGFAVYLIGAGIDWMWELTAVTAVGVCILGLLTGPATLVPEPRAETGRPDPRRRRLAVLAALIVASGIVVTEAVALLAEIEVSSSQAAARAGNLGLSRSRAIAATKIEPWAGTPYLQLALVEESAGDLEAAHIAIDKSISRDRDNWQPWFTAAQIETALGEVTAASHSLARARSLDPRSTLFTS